MSVLLAGVLSVGACREEPQRERPTREPLPVLVPRLNSYLIPVGPAPTGSKWQPTAADAARFEVELASLGTPVDDFGRQYRGVYSDGRKRLRVTFFCPRSFDKHPWAYEAFGGSVEGGCIRSAVYDVRTKDLRLDWAVPDGMPQGKVGGVVQYAGGNASQLRN
ncbi:MAG: hypothetical protein R3B07_07300 [Polyangiaceae bacterium]